MRIYEGPMRSLKHHKNDVKQVTTGMECGLMFGNDYRDICVDDVVQCVRESRVS